MGLDLAGSDLGSFVAYSNPTVHLTCPFCGHVQPMRLRLSSLHVGNPSGGRDRTELRGVADLLPTGTPAHDCSVPADLNDPPAARPARGF